MTNDPYRSQRWFFVFGRRGGVFAAKVRRLWGIQWRGGFVGVLLTEREEK